MTTTNFKWFTRIWSRTGNFQFHGKIFFQFFDFNEKILFFRFFAEILKRMRMMKMKISFLKLVKSNPIHGLEEIAVTPG